MAIYGSNLAGLSFLLEMGADIRLARTSGLSCLHIATTVCCDAKGNTSEARAVLDLILDCIKPDSAALNAEDASGITAYDIARSRGNEDVASVLITAGAYPRHIRVVRFIFINLVVSRYHISNLRE
jgi:ankyrin repeat protein